MSGKKNIKPKVRVDRIISLIAVVFTAVYVVLMFYLQKNSDIPVSEKDISEFAPVVYLSPSNQEDNVYKSLDTNESEVMQTICRSTEKKLAQNNIEVRIADGKLSLKEKVEFINENKFNVHVAVRSNSGDDIKKEEGTACFYNSAISGSKQLSEFIYERVSRLTPTTDRGMHDSAKGENYLYEIAESTVACCMVEVECHNTANNAKWITEHTDELGNSIADGILEYVEQLEKQYKQDLQKKQTESSETQNGKQDKLSKGT